MKPDRIVIGADDERAIAALRTVYAPFMRNHERLLVMDVRSAELTKYAANAMLATRISFMNELANLADLLGADIEMVRQGIGSDPRIGYHFLYPGAGYGGSCFPKDVKALQFTATQLGRPLRVIAAVEEVNDAQKQVLVEKIVGRFGEDLSGRRFALWGLAFKPNTDDMRAAPSHAIVEALLARGAALERLLAAEHVRTSFHREASLATTVKLRVIGRQQQLLRIDFETAPSHEILATKLADYEHQLRDAELVILSDYGKGGLAHITTMIERASAVGKPVLVDPKGEDYTRYRGATILTPNRSEFRQVVGRWKDEAEMTAKAQALRRDLGIAALLVTRAEEGMSLYSESGALTIPAQSREVFDVSGAGDTVIATLGVLLAAGASLPNAVRVANEAAGVVVGKFGTAVVHPNELA